MDSTIEYLKWTVPGNSGHVILCTPVDSCPCDFGGCSSFSSACVWRLCCKPLGILRTPEALLCPPKVPDPSCGPSVASALPPWVNVLFRSLGSRAAGCPADPLESLRTLPLSTPGSLHGCLWSFTVSRIFSAVLPQTHQVMLPKYL